LIQPNLGVVIALALRTLQLSALAPIDAQVVTWVNFRTTVTISSAALDTFHALSDDPDHTETIGKISDYGNFRPLQPLHGRVVYTDGDVADACAQTIPVDPAACHAGDDDHGGDDGHATDDDDHAAAAAADDDDADTTSGNDSASIAAAAAAAAAVAAQNDNSGDDGWRTADVFFAIVLVIIVMLLAMNVVNGRGNRVEAAPAHLANTLV
jgi:hypothetical protein